MPCIYFKHTINDFTCILIIFGINLFLFLYGIELTIFLIITKNIFLFTVNFFQSEQEEISKTVIYRQRIYIISIKMYLT